jgi:4-aminobutyrate aminotransferase-like enzyme
MPIGAFISSPAIMSSLSEHPILGHITTFGGHPVSAAAALATMETLTSGNLIEQAEQKGSYFSKLLKHPRIKCIRQKGLWLGVELADFDSVQKAIQYCLENGLIVDWFLFNQHTIRIAPPLTITKQQIKQAAAVILAALDQLP